MSEKYYPQIAGELNLKPAQVKAVADLLAEGGTVPFIARYRKEMTDSLDEVAIAAIRDRLEQLAELDKRREAILESLRERELLTEELEKSVLAAKTMTELEDIYLPYRPKRRTRAMIAREKGLEPLANLIFEQTDGIDPTQEAAAYLSEEKEVASIDDALAGARDILAEMMNEDKDLRTKMRSFYTKNSSMGSKVGKDKEEEGAKYRDYFDWTEQANKAPSHRILAMLRGEKEGFLKLSICPPEIPAVTLIEENFLKGRNAAAEQVQLAVQDCYKRLLAPSMETELTNTLKEKADEAAIKVFVENMRELLLHSPLGEKTVLGIDPGFRTGCKVVMLNPQGKLLEDTVIYPSLGTHREQEAREIIKTLVSKYNPEAIAIGNGTASRETEAFCKGLGLPASVAVIMVNESGASIYSASDVARREFPDKDITVRGAVSIGRRLMDPLAELVKIDPKSIGVGQYQHDVDQKALQKSLDDTVISCVNNVGVDVNTASMELLSYVSGLSASLAKNVILWRDENGAFASRAQIKKVKRLGPKAFEQCAGFLRIPGGKNPLDASAVHPESYDIVKQMAKDLGCTVAELMADTDRRHQIQLDNYVTEKVGLPTLTDMMSELEKPGRDPRQRFEAFSFSEDVHKMEDLKPGMVLPGIVTNVAAFGAFVDIGVHQDGLVHISQLSDNYVDNPNNVVKVQQTVSVTVMEIDIPRKRISLSMKSSPGNQRQEKREKSTQPQRSGPPRQGNKPPQRDNRPPKQADNWFSEALKRKK